MKTKLSFLALPLCLGMVLVFALAACDDGGGSSGGDPSSSNSGGGGSVITNPSSVVKNDSIYFDEKSFGTERVGDKLYITGKIYGVDADIVKLEFKPTNLISYEGKIELPRSSINLYGTEGKVYIDLTSSSLAACGTKQYIEIKACADQNCKVFSTQNVEYERPASYCTASSSSVVAASSSSEAASWKFGKKETVEVPYNTSVTIGPGSFKLTGDDGQPDIEVTGGKIRLAFALGNDDDEPEQGEAYPSDENHLGSRVPTASRLEDGEVSNLAFLLIYFGDTKYLVQFEAKPFTKWPKTCNYWVATASP